jgi:hypothetical protein
MGFISGKLQKGKEILAHTGPGKERNQRISHIGFAVRDLSALHFPQQADIPFV